MKNITEYLEAIITSAITSIMDHINISKYSPDQKDPLKSQDTTTVVPDNRSASPLESGNSTKIGGMWTLKDDTSSPKLYGILMEDPPNNIS